MTSEPALTSGSEPQAEAAVLATVNSGVAAGTVRAVLLRAEGRAFCARIDRHGFQGLDAAQGKPMLAAATRHGVAAADAITPQALGRAVTDQDLEDGIASLLRDGPRQATFHGR